MDKPLFYAETKMQPGDYRKFLYIATFFRDPYILPLIAFMSCVGAAAASWRSNRLQVAYFLTLWFAILVLACAAICLRVEGKNKKRQKALDSTGASYRRTVFRFFETQMSLENPDREVKSTLNYDRFYKLLETKDFYVFYLDANQITLLCKRDMKNAEGFQSFLKAKFGKRYHFIKL